MTCASPLLIRIVKRPDLVKLGRHEAELLRAELSRLAGAPFELGVHVARACPVRRFRLPNAVQVLHHRHSTIEAGSQPNTSTTNRRATETFLASKDARRLRGAGLRMGSGLSMLVRSKKKGVSTQAKQPSAGAEKEESQPQAGSLAGHDT